MRTVTQDLSAGMSCRVALHALLQVPHLQAKVNALHIIARLKIVLILHPYKVMQLLLIIATINGATSVHRSYQYCCMF